MAEQRAESRGEGHTRTSTARRGMIAAAAALAASLVARDTAIPRVAAGVDGDVVLGAANSTAGVTIISNTYGTITYGGSGYPLGSGFIANGTDGTWGVRGYCLGGGSGVSGRTDNGEGVQGISLGGNGGYGVFGGGYNSGGIGVWGYSNDANSGIGVQGSGGHYGVSGSGSYVGVFGDATTTGSYAVFGLAGNSSYNNGVLGITSGANSDHGIGVRGLGYGPVSMGVYGYGSAYGVNAQTSGTGTALNAASQNGPAVNAASSGYHGVLATTSAPNYAGVFGYAGAAGAIGVQGEATSPSAYAAAFIGSTIVNGAFIVYTGPKSAAVPHPDGSHRLLYCVESPESWFEDFGEGTLAAGKADVKLDADFAAVVDTSTMHVFFTETDGHHALYLTGKNASGFTVAADAEALAARGKKASDVNARFSYRVVAKRKDVAAARLAKVPAPPVTQKVVAAEYNGAPPLPKVPAIPTPPPPRDVEKKG